MRSLVLENSSTYIEYYVPFSRSFDCVKYGFSPEEIKEIRNIISNPSSADKLKKDRSVKFTLSKDLALSDLDAQNTNLSDTITEFSISTDNENDPVTKELVDMISPKIEFQLKSSKKADKSTKKEKPAPVQTTRIKDGASASSISVSPRGLELIKKFEGFKATPYICPGGKLTIGYGKVIKEGEYTSITKDQAESLLRSTVSSFERSLQKYVKVPLNQNQYDALVSFIYNVGAGNFSKSTLVKLLNSGDYDGAANEFLKWVKSDGKVLRGLQRRREEEKALFLS